MYISITRVHPCRIRVPTSSLPDISPFPRVPIHSLSEVSELIQWEMKYKGYKFPSETRLEPDKYVWLGRYHQCYWECRVGIMIVVSIVVKVNDSVDV